MAPRRTTKLWSIKTTAHSAANITCALASVTRVLTPPSVSASLRRGGLGLWLHTSASSPPALTTAQAFSPFLRAENESGISGRGPGPSMGGDSSTDTRRRTDGSAPGRAALREPSQQTPEGALRPSRLPIARAMPSARRTAFSTVPCVAECGETRFSAAIAPSCRRRPPYCSASLAGSWPVLTPQPA